MTEPTWYPIETAPRDGTRIIMLGPICHWNRDGVWVPGERIYACIGTWTTEFKDCGAWEFGSPGYTSEIVPTLWTPLPDSIAKAFEAFDREMSR